MDAADVIDAAIEQAREALVDAGDWLTAVQRRAAWFEVREARTNALDQARRNALSPNAVEGAHQATAEVSAEAIEVLHRVASDPGRLTRAWADEMMAALGDTVYTELVGIAATAMTVDAFDWAMHGAETPIADAGNGAVAEQRPDDVGEVGAWVHQSIEGATANVSRALSLVPVTNRAWRGLSNGLYSRGEGFMDLRWDDRALNRPQAELVAARTTAELECFY